VVYLRLHFFDHDIPVVQDFWHAGDPDVMPGAAIRVLCAAARKLGFAAVEVRLAARQVAARRGHTRVSWSAIATA
jgi:hypothetical protein